MQSKDLPADDLLHAARCVRARMREHEAALGLVFPRHVRLAVAMDAIESGIAARRLLDVAVGYLMLREVLGPADADDTGDRTAPLR